MTREEQRRRWRYNSQKWRTMQPERAREVRQAYREHHRDRLRERDREQQRARRAAAKAALQAPAETTSVAVELPFL